MKNADMPASPAYHEGVAVTLGLTKRELFAAMAMQGILANPDSESTVMDHDTAAASAVASADALLAALEPKP